MSRRNGGSAMPREPYVVYLRRIWSHEFVNERIAWTRLQALMWLIQYAQFAPTTKRFGDTEIDIPAGHFVASLRMLARRFRWSNPRVLRFLESLKNGVPGGDPTIVPVSVTPAGMLYRFVNWELHQPRATGSVPPSVPPTVPPSVPKRSNDIKKEERTTWLTPFLNAWFDQYGTRITRIGKEAAHFANVRDAVGPDEALARWRRYLVKCPNDKASPARFAETHPTYASIGAGNGAQTPAAPAIPGARNPDDARKLKAAGY